MTNFSREIFTLWKIMKEYLWIWTKIRLSSQMPIWQSNLGVTRNHTNNTKYLIVIHSLLLCFLIEMIVSEVYFVPTQITCPLELLMIQQYQQKKMSNLESLFRLSFRPSNSLTVITPSSVIAFLISMITIWTTIFSPTRIVMRTVMDPSMLNHWQLSFSYVMWGSMSQIASLSC